MSNAEDNTLDSLQPKHKEKNTASSSEVSSNKNQQVKEIGKIKASLSDTIGKGTNGTFVCKGYYEDREVAVKCLPKSHFNRDLETENERKNLDRKLEAERERKHLIVSDHSQNIVRYCGTEHDSEFIYLALERCDCNLDNLIQMYPTNSSQDKPLSEDLGKLKNTFGDNIELWKKNIDRPSPLLLKLMRDVVSGLVVLHGSSIVHRDLKPQNILISRKSRTLCAKLADMGISRQLRPNELSLSHHKSSDCAATGWKAPEQLLKTTEETPAVDLFSLGCVLFFSVTGGEHPYGNYDERDGNIVNENYEPKLSSIKDYPEASDLISSLIKFRAEDRLQATMVLPHPLFWNAKKRLYFLRDTSDSVRENSNLKKKLQNLDKTLIPDHNWRKVIDNKIINHKSKHIKPPPKYNSRRVRDLLRFIRNMLSHYRQLPNDIQALFGQLYEEFDDYFTRRFPMLFFEVYNVVRDCCKEDEFFMAYFEGDDQ